MSNIFRTGIPTKFKLGTQTEQEDTHWQRPSWPPRSKVRAARSRDASDSCSQLADKSRTKHPRNTKIGRKVVHPTSNNAHQFQGQRQRSRSPRRHNVETGSASYLPNGKAYELQTWCGMHCQLSRQAIKLWSWVLARGRGNTVSAAPAATQLVQEEIASVFVSRFRCGLQRFFREENPFSTEKQIWKLVALRLVHQCARKFPKSEKMGAKFVRTTSTI